MKLTCAIAWIWAIVMRTHGNNIHMPFYETENKEKGIFFFTITFTGNNSINVYNI